MATSRGIHGNVATRPYVLTWRGNLPLLAGNHGELGAYASIAAAIKAGQHWRDAAALQPRSHKPWFTWSVVDRRTGETIKTIT